MEDNWIDTENNAEPSQSKSTVYLYFIKAELNVGIRGQIDLLMGLCIGFFVGILSAASLKIPGIFNSKQKLGTTNNISILLNRDCHWRIG